MGEGLIRTPRPVDTRTEVSGTEVIPPAFVIWPDRSVGVTHGDPNRSPLAAGAFLMRHRYGTRTNLRPYAVTVWCAWQPTPSQMASLLMAALHDHGSEMVETFAVEPRDVAMHS